MNILVVADVGGDATFHVGDEAMFEANVSLLRRLFPGVEVVVASSDPPATAARYGVRAVLAEIGTPQTGLTGGLAAAIDSSDAVLVSGGGNLSATWPEHLWLRVQVLRRALRAGVPTAVVGQTLGPRLEREQAAALGEVLSGAGLVGVRDAASAALARRIGVAAERIVYQPDDAFFLPPAEESPSSLAGDEPWIALTLDGSFASARAADRLARLAYDLELVAVEIGARVLFVPHFGRLGSADAEGDASAAIELVRHFTTPARLEILPVPTAREARRLAGTAHLVVSSRYHPLVFASAAGVPSLGVYSDAYTRIKLHAALAHVGQPERLIAGATLAEKGLARPLRSLWRDRQQVRTGIGLHLDRVRTREAWRVEALKCALTGADWRQSDAARDDLAAAAVAPGSAPDLDRPLAAGRPAVQCARRETGTSTTSGDSRMLDEQVWRDFDEAGYVRLGRILDAAAVAELCQRADDLALGRVEVAGIQMQLDTGGSYEALAGAVAKFDVGTLLYRKIQGLESDEVFGPLVRHALIAEICARVYGPHCAISIFRAMVMNKPAGQGTHLPWHQDGGLVWELDRDPEVTVWVALDPATRANGCLQVIPGSHRLGLLTRQGSTLDAELAARHCPEAAVAFLEIGPGEALLLHNHLLHRSGVNTSPTPRRAFTACYMDGRTVNRLTGGHFPTVFGQPWSDEEMMPAFERQLRADNGRLRAAAEEAERYARSLEAERTALRETAEEAVRYARSLEAELAKQAAAKTGPSPP